MLLECMCVLVHAYVCACILNQVKICGKVMIYIKFLCCSIDDMNYNIK